METKSFNLEIKGVTDEGVVSSYLSTFGNEDKGGDVVVKGAFAESLVEDNGVVVCLWQHDYREPIGLLSCAENDHGLLVEAKLDLNVQRGKECLSLIKKGIIKSMSMGYITRKKEEKDGKRYLLNVKLMEGSFVTFPMNEGAAILGAKCEETVKVAPMEVIVNLKVTMDPLNIKFDEDFFKASAKSLIESAIQEVIAAKVAAAVPPVEAPVEPEAVIPPAEPKNDFSADLLKVVGEASNKMNVKE